MSRPVWSEEGGNKLKISSNINFNKLKQKGKFNKLNNYFGKTEKLGNQQKETNKRRK